MCFLTRFENPEMAEKVVEEAEQRYRKNSRTGAIAERAFGAYLWNNPQVYRHISDTGLVIRPPLHPIKSLKIIEETLEDLQTAGEIGELLEA